MSLNHLSELFKAFEWLRQEGLNGNKHAYVMFKRVVALERMARYQRRKKFFGP